MAVQSISSTVKKISNRQISLVIAKVLIFNTVDNGMAVVGYDEFK